MTDQMPKPTKEQLIQRLAELIGGSKNAQIWLNNPHPFLDGRTPQSYLDEGKLQVLDYMVHAIEAGQTS